MDEHGQVYIYEYKNERFKLFKLLADIIWASMGLLAIAMLVATFCGSRVMIDFISLIVGG